MYKHVSEVLGRVFECCAPQVKEHYRDRDTRKRTYRMVDHPRLGKKFQVGLSPLYTLEADEKTGGAKLDHMDKVQLLWEDGSKSHCPLKALAGFAKPVEAPAEPEPKPESKPSKRSVSRGAAE